jgi:hypothetical protein
MKRIRSGLDRAFRTRFPKLYYQVVQRPKLHFQFQTEKRLISGEKLSNSANPSILFFTTQKCASRYVSRVIAALAEHEDMVRADYDAFNAMLRPSLEQNPFAQNGAIQVAFQPNGYYYGPIGTYRSIPGVKAYKTVLQLRDPRDVLTSLYFSTAFSHALISEKVIRRREEAQQMTIDDFVLMETKEYVPIYQEYVDFLLDKPNVLFLKYEDMVGGFEEWLAELIGHIGISADPALLNQLRKEADFSVTSEDPYSQRRQVTPGDHKRKLKPETITELDRLFNPILKRLKYPSNKKAPQ